MTSGGHQQVTSNVVEALRLLAKGREDAQVLTSTVNAILTPQPGPYALFHHLSHLSERVGDVREITLRLGAARLELREVFERRNRERLEGREASVELHRIHDELVARLKLDLESLYVFSNMMLDQLAHVVAYCAGVDEPQAWNFQRLTMSGQAADPGALAEFTERHLRDVLWLSYQIRFYRNIFVEH